MKILVEREGLTRISFKQILTLRVASHLHHAPSTMIEPSGCFIRISGSHPCHNKTMKNLAEREGFEPSIQF